MYKFAGYVLRDPNTMQYADVFFTSRDKAEKFCQSRGISVEYIKQVCVNE